VPVLVRSLVLVLVRRVVMVRRLAPDLGPGLEARTRCKTCLNGLIPPRKLWPR
jgi:hypothetical protein